MAASMLSRAGYSVYHLLVGRVCVFMGEDARAEAPGGLPLCFRRAARSPQRRRGPGPAPPAARRLKDMLQPALRRALGRCSGCRGVQVDRRWHASARQELHRQLEGRPRRCARAAPGSPQPRGWCCCLYWSSVGSRGWAKRPLFGPHYGGWAHQRDSGPCRSALRARATRTRICA